MSERTRKWTVAALYAGLLALVLAGGVFWGWVRQSPVATAAIRQIVTNQPPQEVFADTPRLTLLVLGCDEDRAPGGRRVLRKQARSDMMLVARLDFERGEITGLSIPRDTEATVPGYRVQKINAFHAIGANDGPESGKELAKRAVEGLLPNLRIDRVVVLDFEAFQEMVDMVGGVQIDVEKRMRYRDRRGNVNIDFRPGPRLLDGYNAMMYVRYRHGDDDFHRQERQKRFMLAFKDRVMANAAALPQVANKAVEVMGGGLRPDEIVAVARFAERVGNDKIRFGVLPVVPAGGTDLRLDGTRLPAVLADLHLDGAAGVTSSR